ncbi:MAG: LssY C-terminal domain-containing protein, partial [Thioalkalispiraceae bacterium]
GGFLLGFAWLCIIAIAYRRHNRDALITSNKFLPGSLILVLLVISYPYQSIEKTYAEPRFEQHYVINKNAWLDSGWQTLPAIRQDLKAKHQHPLNLQWAGEPHELEGILLAQGWHNSAINSLKLVQWFNPAADIEQLPLLPQVHEGRYDDIRLFKVMPDRQQLLVLRLWQSDTLLKQAQEKQRIWIGNVSFVKRKKLLLLSYLYTGNEFEQALREFTGSLKLADTSLTLKPVSTVTPESQQRQVFLLYD